MIVLLSVVGVGIVAGFGFLAWEVYNRATNPERATATAAAETALPATQGLHLPAGSSVVQMVPVGNRLVFEVRGEGAGLYVLNPITGEVTTPVKLHP